MKILIINGPNLNLLGNRETDIYGSQKFDAYLELLRDTFPEHNIDYFQSNVEGEIINKLHSADGSYEGIILNAAGYTHTSVSIADAVKAIETAVVEVHISNILSREHFRHVSLIGPHVKGSVIGFGLDSYRIAVLSFR
ncbi:MAG: 3-dehydroquinate dehydratase [Bacteroidales bacterium]|nr:3-dehydroquinate dehydratase [Bacteroidales bacterium]